MGWNDRLPDFDHFLASEEERQAYFDWQEYQHYLALLDAEIEAQSAPPTPERMGLSSQTIDPDSLPAAKDIFVPRDRSRAPKKEEDNGQETQTEANPAR